MSKHTIFEDDHEKIYIWNDECKIDPKKKTCNGKKASLILKRDSRDWKLLEQEMNDGHTINQKTFAILTILTIITSALGWCVVYRLNWDLGELIFPVSIYPYWVQSIFSIILFTLLFILFLKITFNVYNANGKNIDNLS